MSGAATGCFPIIVIMGVSGSGKTTLGSALSERLHWVYRDGDEFHSAANRSKMRAAIPLDDNDRLPWLAAIAGWVDEQRRAHQSVLVGCSALKRKYRDFLRSGRRELWFLYLKVPSAELRRRVRSRRHAYMPAALLDSQLETLEEPVPDEPRCITLDAGGDLATTVERAMQALTAAGVVKRMPCVSG